jgi:hypothetical protein
MQTTLSAELHITKPGASELRARFSFCPTGIGSQNLGWSWWGVGVGRGAWRAGSELN